MTPQYRTPFAHEAEAMGQLHLACWQEAYAGLMSEGDLLRTAASQRADLWRRIIADDSIFKLAAFISDGPVGFVVSGAARPPAVDFADGEIQALYLRRAHHNRGIGRQLFLSARDDWAQRGGQRLAALVLAGNARGRQFYARMGAAEAGSLTTGIDSPRLIEIACVFPANILA